MFDELNVVTVYSRTIAEAYQASEVVDEVMDCHSGPITVRYRLASGEEVKQIDSGHVNYDGAETLYRFFNGNAQRGWRADMSVLYCIQDYFDRRGVWTGTT